VAARVQEFVDAGARHVVFAIGASGDRLAMMRRILSEVVPRITIAA